MPICQACSADVPSGQNFCQECGEPFSPTAPSLDIALDKTISTGPPVMGDRAWRQAVSDTISRPSTGPSTAKARCPSCGAEHEEGQGCDACSRGADGEERDSLLGLTIADNFRVEAILGEGAMGKVYRARQLSLDKVVAIKVLHPHLAGDRAVARRFHREARAASRLNHPNSLHIIDFGQTPDGTLYIAMEFIEGSDLHDTLREAFPLPINRIVHLIGQVCLALDEAHAAGIVHRDLKPENIMVVRRRDGSEDVKVCDFGIAKIKDPGETDVSAPITVAGIVCGTPEYMSPEQCRGEELDGRADLYSVGVILYQLITNALPFVADSPLGVVTRQLTDEAVRPTLIQPKLAVTQALENVVLKSLTKDRSRRYSSALELKDDLDRVLKGEAVAPPPSTQDLQQQPPLAPRAQGTRWPIVLGASISAGLAAFLAVWFLVPSLGGGGESPELQGAQLSPPPPETPHPAAGANPADAAPGPEKALPATADADLRGGALAADAELADEPTSAPSRPSPLRRRNEKVAKAPPPPLPPPPTATNPPEKTSFQLGREAFRSGNVAQAIQHFEVARGANPGNAQIHRMLGKCYYRVGQTAQGRASYERYLQLRPDAEDRQFIETIIGRH